MNILIVFIIIAIVLLILYLFPIICVCGVSMQPTYIDGEIVFSTRIFSRKRIKIGDVMILTPPKKTRDEVKYVIKRVCDIKDGKYFFMGDNRRDSYDSRNYGYVSKEHLVSKVINQRERKG